MPKIPIPLTDREIRGLKPKDKIYKKCDGRGLYIFVDPSGRKYFALEYKNPADNKIKRLNLGDFPEFSLAMAREERFKLEQKVRDGIDVKRESEINEQANFKKLAQRWLEIKAASVEPNTLYRDKRLLEMYAYPFFENRSITDITVTDVIEILKKIEAKGSLEMMKRLYSLLNQIWQSAYYIAPHNVIASINYRFTFKKVREKNYATLTKNADIKALWQSIDEYSGDVRTKYALKFAVLTALRPFNVRSAKWEYVDFDEGVINIPAGDMKMREAFTLPLSRQALELLKEYKGYNLDQIYLFGSLYGSARYMSENTLNVALRRMGFSKDEIVSHGFRAMFSTVCNENIDTHGLNFDIIEKCLAHKGTDKIRAAYNRAQNLAQMRAMMQWWADYLDNL